ncbi:hypothetical protein EJ08DRAFT_649437 [Tothia fuscella]|uniref:Uncharacterized protein n=1 Tax=Tothia fuscella TaxID=1048955 RepID=A0A9P4NS26_9PEZI|nr:hypothetical protein EJ08DRAFT_649437 [Tothia fuscella]
MIHPLRYAAKAVAGDPALRLAFELTIPLIGGGSTREFIQCQGLKAPLKVNSFVDWIEGNTDEEIGLRPRRFMLRHKGRGVAKWEYT